MPYLAACGAVFALRYVLDRENSADLVSYGWSVTASSTVGFFITIGSQHWLRHSCDSIAVNTLAAVVCGGLVLALAGWLKHQDMATRAGATLGAASLTVAVLLPIEPVCVGGPFGMVGPAIWPIWLSEVREMQPLLAVFQKNPLTGSAIAAFPAVAVVATLVMLQYRATRRDMGFLAVAAALLIAVLVTLGAIRAYSYAIWFGMPIVAAMALRMFAVLRLKTVAARVAATLALTPMVVSAGAITIAHAAGFDDKDGFDRPESKACLRSASYLPLAQLPAGIVATDVSYGPFLLALTPHSVLAGPYHHLSKGIITAHRSLSEPPEQARQILAEQRVTYVMVCGPHRPTASRSPSAAAAVGPVRAGAVPDWLEPVSTPSLRRVSRQALAHGPGSWTMANTTRSSSRARGANGWPSWRAIASTPT